MKPENCCAESFVTNLPQTDLASEFGAHLLADLGISGKLTGTTDHPALAWRRSGLWPLCGSGEGQPQMPPLPLTLAADGALLALKSLTDQPEKLPLNGSLLLGERTQLLALRKRGEISAGGDCRLIAAADGRIALQLSRQEDWNLIEAWLEKPATSWDAIKAIVKSKSADQLVGRAIMLGLPIAHDRLCPLQGWFRETIYVPATQPKRKPRVADLSGLWAGPLAGNLLHLSGAEVIKVESTSRPDGARRGNLKFYNFLNSGKKSVAFDFQSPEGLHDLTAVLLSADIVIEASRPRALKQLGIDAAQMMKQKPGKVWVRLLAHGDNENRIGFGDDIGVAAGLSTVMEKAWRKPCFVGDAIADPLSGIFAGLAAWAKWQQGGGQLISLSMRDIVRHAMGRDQAVGDPAAQAMDWQERALADQAELYPMRKTAGTAPAAGAHTREVMSALC